MPQPSLKNYSLAYIRALCIGISSNDEVAAQLNVPLPTLEEYLSQFGYDQIPLTIELLKTATNQQLRKTLGDVYSYPLEKRFKITHYSLYQIHCLIRASDSMRVVIAALGTSYEVLLMYIGQFWYQEEPLDFNKLEAMEIRDVQNGLGDKYYQPMENIKKTLTETPFNRIHYRIRRSENLSHAAAAFGASYTAFETLLGRNELSYDTLKNTSEDSLKLKMGEDYNKPLKGKPRPISTYTLAEIHSLIKKIKTKSRTANQLGFHLDVLKTALSRLSYNGNPLTIEDLKDLTVIEAELIWKADYDRRLQEIASRKRKRQEAGLDPDDSSGAKQVAPPLPIPNNESCFTGTKLGFFRQPLDSALITSTCPSSSQSFW